MSSTFDYEKLKLFYIGKEKINEEESIPLVYKNKHLTTHAAIIGMTGSGKTDILLEMEMEEQPESIFSIMLLLKKDYLHQGLLIQIWTSILQLKSGKSRL